MHAYSIIKDGNAQQDYKLKIQNLSALDISCRVTIPYDGQNSSFLIYSVLPQKMQISKGEVKQFTIKVKIDMKKISGGNFCLEDILEEVPINAPPNSANTDQQLNTLFNIHIIDTEIFVPIPVRVLYKNARKQIKGGIVP